MCILKNNHFAMEKLCKLLPACSLEPIQINRSKSRKLQRKRRRHLGQNGTTRIIRRQTPGGEDNIEEI
jgi:rRNA processing protein Krr1/Pno1